MDEYPGKRKGTAKARLKRQREKSTSQVLQEWNFAFGVSPWPWHKRYTDYRHSFFRGIAISVRSGLSSAVSGGV